jgi:hypothetical protein
VDRSLTIANGARRRGYPRETRKITDVHFAWRVYAASQQLKALLGVLERGERTAKTTQDLCHLEQRIVKLADEAQIAMINHGLSVSEGKDKIACVGS